MSMPSTGSHFVCVLLQLLTGVPLSHPLFLDLLPKTQQTGICHLPIILDPLSGIAPSMVLVDGGEHVGVLESPAISKELFILESVLVCDCVPTCSSSLCSAS